jgi:hypothetical protein
MLQFRGSVVTSDAGLLAYRELDDALGLSSTAGDRLADARTGKNGRHALVGMLQGIEYAIRFPQIGSCSLRSCRELPPCDRRRWQRQHEHPATVRASKTSGEVRAYDHAARLFDAQQAEARLTSCRTDGPACRGP